MAGLVVVGRSSVPALVVVMSGGVRLASGAFIFRAVDLLVAVLVATEASYGRLFGRRVGTG